MVRRVALSTMPKARAKVLKLFGDPYALVRGYQRRRKKTSSAQGITVNTAAQALAKSASRAEQLFRELELTGVIVRTGKSKKGDIVYVPSPGFEDLLKEPVLPLNHLADLVGGTASAPENPSLVTEMATDSSSPR